MMQEDAEEGRRRREASMVEIRKSTEEDNLQNKLPEGLEVEQQLPVASASAMESDRFPAMVAGVWSDDSKLQLEATTQFRNLLIIGQRPLTDKVVQSGVVPRFVQFLTRDDIPQLQCEVAWSLTNIMAGGSENTKVVIDLGAIPLFVKLLGSPDDEVCDQAVWSLGNIAGDSPACRDLVLSHGALMPLLAQFNEHKKLHMIRSAAWTLSNLCRGKPQPAFEQTKLALPVLGRLIHSNDEEVVSYVCRALAYISDGTNDKIQAVIEAGVCPKLVELLSHPSVRVLFPALRTAGNIVTGDDMQTQRMIGHGILPCLFNLLVHDYTKNIQREALWVISNITAGNVDQIDFVFEAGIIPPLVQLLQNVEFSVKEQAAWAIRNATCGGNHNQIKYLVSQGCIKPLCDLLSCSEPRVVAVCLEGLDNILNIGESENIWAKLGVVNEYAELIENADGFQKIENLRNHDSYDIYVKAVNILGTYWNKEYNTDDDDAEPMTPFHSGE